MTEPTNIADAITAAQGRVADCYTAISNKGGTLPQTQNLANMPTAIGSIPTGGGASTKYGATVDNFLGNVDANGVLQIPSQVDLVFTGVKEVAANVFQYAFSTNKTVKSISFPDLESLTKKRSLYYIFGQHSDYYNLYPLTSVSFGKLKTVSGTSTLQGAFYGETGITTIDISKLETVSGSDGCSNMFNSCTGITNIDLSGLKTVSGSNGCDSMFYGCTGITSLDISGLETISGSSGCKQMFFVNNNYTNSLTSVTFTKLSTISSSYALQQAFMYRKNLQSVSFPALTPSSFGSYTNQFNNMLKGITGCTVHFPSSIQSTIGSWSDVTSGFGGTNTSILFDL